MKRGDIYSAATGSGFGSKPRPVVIMQSLTYDGLQTRLVIPLTSDDEGMVGYRPVIHPDPANNLRSPSAAMVDVVLTVYRHKFGRRLGALADADMGRIELALLIMLGIAA